MFLFNRKKSKTTEPCFYSFDILKNIKAQKIVYVKRSIELSKN